MTGLDLSFVFQSLLIAAVTGGVGSFATVKALRIHISYLKEHNIGQDTRIKEALDEAKYAVQIGNQALARLDVTGPKRHPESFQ
jgi:hypothetical protein